MNAVFGIHIRQQILRNMSALVAEFLRLLKSASTFLDMTGESSELSSADLI